MMLILRRSPVPLNFASTDSKEIDHNDVDFEKITGSLTRKQAEAVRKRIDTLNQSTKKKLGIHVAQPARHSTSNYPTDVRTIFPVKTSGQPSNAEQIPTTSRPALLRKSYSEGIHVHVQKPPSLENGTKDNDFAHTTCRLSHLAGMLSSPMESKEVTGGHLHPCHAMARRSSDELRYRTGKHL